MSCCESSAAEDVLVLEGGWTGYVPPSRDDGDRYLQTWNGNIKRVTERAILSLSLSLPAIHPISSQYAKL